MSFFGDTVHAVARSIGLTARRCPICGTIMPEKARMCAACAATLPLCTGGYCPTCGAMSGRPDAPPSRCPDCRHTPPPWDTLFFHGPYDTALRELIISYKFNNNYSRNTLLSDLAVTTFQARNTELPDCIIPVPLHTRRLLWRGFNQSLEIAKALGRHLERPVLKKGLTRTRNTPPQTRLGHTQRQKNIKDAFMADEKRVANRTVLLVDDVYTTGSTLRECAKTLKRAGVLRMSVLVLARAQQMSG
ncbi:ComF family protein [Pseudodesulfovibrio sp. JC047]|uniref:ComF family protein n=1 Tax=Pseudodesulfovibrio sp. JC047 TaxID=2683199 RepID=UPI0013D31D94|nr:ComF family protein [Pseudodesulfovibrio sp. JC047]NDV18435.1 ComF family protein [Pseudodesulfovibrio sp. JC047]